MKKKNLFLITAIISTIVFIGFLGEKDPQEFFGFEINIWIYRIAWLLISIAFYSSYFSFKKDN